MCKKIAKEAFENIKTKAVESQKALTENEKIAYAIAAMAGVFGVSIMVLNIKMRAAKRRVKKCEKRLDDLENMCTDPNNK